MGSQSRFFIKYKVIGQPGHFWTEYRVWDVETKSLKTIMNGCITHCKQEAEKILNDKFVDNDIDILTFNLVEAITKVEL